MAAKENGEYIRIAGGYLEVRQKVGPGVTSSSGKSKVVVSTGGFTEIQGSDVRVNLTAIIKN
jgi:F0F1-type ATP synthase epsilon subunit